LDGESNRLELSVRDGLLYLEERVDKGTFCAKASRVVLEQRVQGFFGRQIEQARSSFGGVLLSRI
jgi:hypothetical protein